MTEVTYDQFERMPDSYINDVAEARIHRRGETEKFLVKGGLKIRLVATTGAADEDKSVEDLNKYEKNPNALKRALERSFDRAAAGQVITLKIRHWNGGNRFAVLRPIS